VIRPVRKPPGQSLSDFRILRLIAEAWGCGGMFESWQTPEAVFTLLGKLSAGRPCDISGITGYEQIDREGGIQWPYPAATQNKEMERRLFADGRFFTPDERARFLFDPPAESVPEPTCPSFPFLLLTGRGSSSQWHTQTRTSKSAILRKLSPQELLLEIHPEDAAAMGSPTMTGWKFPAVAPRSWRRPSSPAPSSAVRSFYRCMSRR
jgi:assimilatory nitrate reductase catalytic subunit